MIKSYYQFFLIVGLLISAISSAQADNNIISPFPLEHYSQSISQWINPTDPDYDKPLLSEKMQAFRYDDFYQHYFGAYSPWSMKFVNQLLNLTGTEELKNIQQSIMDGFSNQNKTPDEISYGENFIPYSASWLSAISDNINFSEWGKLNYSAANRAIAIDNLMARALPTDDPLFYNFKLPGEGYPFDMLQMSAVWVGTPLYILKETKNQAWSLVLTPEFVGWVKSNGIARVNDSFVTQWETAAKTNLAAITHTQTSIMDNDNQFLFTTYVGTVFPVKQISSPTQLWVPVMGSTHQAQMKSVNVSLNDITIMPLSLTPHHIANVIETLIGRPYGWGNLYFYNDCSAELKNLYAPFGIWLPRNSTQQISAGTLVDMTSAAPPQRIAYLMKNGKKFLTLIYLGGHIIMYAGNVINPNDPNHALMGLTYQDLWGLYPHPAVRRAVIGKAAFFPMLLQYPEDPALDSIAARKYFKVIYLDEMPDSIKFLHFNLRNYMLGGP